MKIKYTFFFLPLFLLGCQSSPVCSIPEFYITSPLPGFILGTAKGSSYEEAYQNALKEISLQLSVHILQEMNVTGDEKKLYLDEVTKITSQIGLTGVKVRQKHESCGIYYISLFIEESSAQKQLHQQNETLEKIKKTLENRISKIEEKQEKIISKIEEKEKYQKIKAKPLFYIDFNDSFMEHAFYYRHQLKDRIHSSLDPSLPMQVYELYESQKDSQAQSLCLKIKEKDPQSTFSLACLGFLSLKNKKKEESLAYFQLALQYENNLKTHYLYYLKSYLFFESQKYQESLNNIQELYQKSNSSCLLSQYLGNIYSTLEDFENAQKYYSSCIDRKKDLNFYHTTDQQIFKEILYNRALLYHKNGYFSEAWNDYSRALQIDSTFSKALFYRGFLQKAQKSDASGDIDIQKALKINPELKKEM